MADNSFPWRDIYSNEAWAKILSLQSPEAGASPGKLKSITELIARYHAIPKDQKQTIDQRTQLLNDIRAAAQEWMGTPGVNTDKSGQRKYESTDGKYIKDIGPWIASLYKRAGKKCEYLLDLKQFLDTHKHASTLGSAANFLEYLNKKQTKRALDPKTGKPPETMSLVPGNRVEKIDPFRRGGAEFSLDRDNEITPTTNPMSKALCLWLETNSDKPFFMWLENTAICLATPGLDRIWDEELRRVKRTWYSGDQPDVYLVSVQGPLLMGRPADNGNQQNLQPFDTSGAKIVKGEFHHRGQFAFVWATDGSIYSAEHKAGKLHHSSFTAGRKVKAAGMWSVENGKVSYVDDNTGHYQTDAYHLFDFLDFLNKNHLVADDATVSARTIKLMGQETGESRIPVSTFLERFRDPKEREALRAGINTMRVKAPSTVQAKPAASAAAAATLAAQAGLPKGFVLKRPPVPAQSSSGSSSSGSSSSTSG